MAIVLRATKGSELTHTEMDTNFTETTNRTLADKSTAEAGTDNTLSMSPLRTAEAIAATARLEITHTIEPNTTGLGISPGVVTTHADYATMFGAGVADATWHYTTDSGLYYYYANSTAGFDQASGDVTLPPYICGTNGENRLLIQDTVSNNQAAYVLLPSLNEGAAIGQTLDTDHRYLVDSSTARRCFIMTDGGFNENLSSSIKITRTLYDTPYNYLYFYSYQHAEFEFYPAGTKGAYTDMAWEPSGKMALILAGDNYDGWGNSAELDINGRYVQRFTLSDRQYSGPVDPADRTDTARALQSNSAINSLIETAELDGYKEIVTANSTTIDYATCSNVITHTLTANTTFIAINVVAGKPVTLMLTQTGGPWTVTLNYAGKAVPVTINGASGEALETVEIFCDGTDLFVPTDGGVLWSVTV